MGTLGSPSLAFPAAAAEVARQNSCTEGLESKNLLKRGITKRQEARTPEQGQQILKAPANMSKGLY